MIAHQVQLRDLEKALKIAARVVVMYGEVYLPVFNRLHSEVEKMKAVQDKESLAIQLAKEYADME